MQNYLTLSVPVVLLGSPNLNPYFSLDNFEIILLLVFSNLLCMINSYFFITKCLIALTKESAYNLAVARGLNLMSSPVKQFLSGWNISFDSMLL